MADYDGLTPGQILADASVAEFIKSLGLGIAEAQKALDENSVNQIAEFIVPREGLGGKTLLDLGLSPAFYHYQHADLQCSLQLSLKVEKDFSLGLNLNGSLNDTSTGSGSSSSNETINETGSSTRTEARQAAIEITSASAGTLTVGGQAFPLNGKTPAERISNLQKALTTNSSSGIARVLYQLQPSSLTITTDAISEKVKVTDHSVAFISGGYDSSIIRIGSNTDTTYTLDDSPSPSVTVATTAQSDLAAYATHVKSEVEAKSYLTVLVAPNESILTAKFDTGIHTLPSSDQSTTIALMRLAQAIKQQNVKVEIEGFSDRQRYADRAHSNDLNKKLGNNRAKEIQNILYKNEPTLRGSGLVTIKPSRGETAAREAGDNLGVNNGNFRKAEITTPDRNEYWLFVHSPSDSLNLQNIKPDMRTDHSSTNGFIYLFAPTPLLLTGKKVTLDGTDFPFSGAAITGGAATGTPQAYAQNLTDDINENTSAQLKASVLDNVVTVTKDGDKFQLTLVTAEQRQIEMTATSGITVTRQFTRTRTTNQTRQNTGNRTVAVGASLDVRFSRKFEMNVTGNSSISARLVSIPAPPQFLETIQKFLKEE